MNKYQEALDRLASINLDIIEDGETKLNQSIYGIHDRANLEMSGDLQTLQELVDKETPMKVCGDGDDHICPKCNEYFCICEVQNKINYCPNCGQKLDWRTK